ncbi:restriction endonuclease subunit S [Endozoicomonas gorgoniicola]|uniref:Restriction endonuclease subunit S n=1 Tax=Endozoicomonas gorgoniicola TaxID=1234144 RepID=A0ABT3MYV2_9GAMM|nr:restriction endonuclease subunit S [Endozoicomonas gorgoniicola]MCW7554544.1 restriction endonuclease subunit S [Endozoicomonas gorgoniicola]
MRAGSLKPVAESGKYKAYSEYKDSGVEWFGSIPSHWQVAGFKKYLSSIVDYRGKTPNKTDSGILLVTARNIKQGQLDYEKSQEFIDPDDYESVMIRGKPEIGDVLFTTEAPLGEVAIVDRTDFALAQRIIKFSGMKSILDNYYFRYLLMSQEFQQSLQMYASGSTALGIKAERFVYLRKLLPPYSEQRIIANFLDHETAKIDTLIEEQQSLIRLLQEKRQAVISHTVTKGLNPDAPMKDSGVEWLGEVPEHWVVRRLKHASDHQSGIPKGKDLTGRKTIEVPMLRVANVQDGYLDLTDVHTIKIEPSQLDRFMLKKGDVLMNEGGDNDKLGRGAVWTGEINPCIHQNHVHAIRPREIEPEWLELLTGSSYAKFHFYRVAKQSTNLASISSSSMKETPLVIPPVEERREIMSYLKKMKTNYDSLETECQKQITLLSEHRTALISAAVTGKIDVRDWTAPKE